MRKHKARVTAGIYVLLIFGLALLPGATREDDAPVHVAQLLHNLLHIPLYGGLAYTLTLAARTQAMTLSGLAAVAVVLTGLAVGVIDEWIQSHVSGRTASLGDVGLDVVGLVLVALAVRMRGMSSSRSWWSSGMLSAGPRR